jgi:DNA-directed RNA polymerase specialized sigma24 family protein
VSISDKWYVGPNGVLFCKHCRLPSRDMSRGPEHSQCWIEPSDSFGSPSDVDEPLKLSTGFSSRLPHRFTRYLSVSHDPYEKAIKALHERYPQYADVYWSHVVDGEKLKDIAQRLGISTENAKKRKQRGAHFVDDRYVMYGGDKKDVA